MPGIARWRRLAQVGAVPGALCKIADQGRSRYQRVPHPWRATSVVSVQASTTVNDGVRRSVVRAWSTRPDGAHHCRSSAVSGDALKTADHGPNHDPWVRIPRPPRS